MPEINLLCDLPPSPPRPLGRAFEPENARVARQFGQAYFDGDRQYGYGGYWYDRRWQPVARRLVEHYGLRPGHRVLDVGCAKGFLLHDLERAGLARPDLVGLDLSAYASHIAHQAGCTVLRGTAERLPFADHSFELAISLNTLHNLPHAAVVQALHELQRVARRQYIQVDSWFSEEQRQTFEAWRLTALTVYDPATWRQLFDVTGYAPTGDWYFTVCQ